MMMKTRFAVCLALYGALLAALAWLGFKSGVAAAPGTLWVGGVAGLLCVGWGLTLAAGRRGKAGAVHTMAVLALTLLVEAVHGWLGDTVAESAALLVPVLTTLLLLTTMALLMWLLHGGIFTGDSPPRPRQGSQPKPAPLVSGQACHT